MTPQRAIRSVHEARYPDRRETSSVPLKPAPCRRLTERLAPFFEAPPGASISLERQTGVAALAPSGKRSLRLQAPYTPSMGRGKRRQTKAAAGTSWGGAVARRDSDGAVEWLDAQGRLHREDGPAVEGHDGTLRWFDHGQLHRDGGPAVEWADGDREWFRYNERHREDGPAVEWADGSPGEWHLDGRRLSEEEWREELHARALAEVIVAPGQRTRPSALSR